MEQEQLQKILNTVKENFEVKEKDLFTLDIHERTLTCTFARYLVDTGYFNNWNVDCEYNRMGEKGDPKRSSDGSLVIPDISIHQRTKEGEENNLLAIQAKKSDTYIKGDLDRLPEIKKIGPYQHVVQLIFNTREKNIDFEFIT